jgi:hypothetical protein
MKFFLLTILGILALSVTACKHPGKENNNTAEKSVKADNIVKEVFSNELGEEMEVSIDNSKNTAIVHLDGKTYELEKDSGLSSYTTFDDKYEYSNVKGEITFLKKDYNMVLFHHKSKAETEKPTSMASY